MTQPLPPPWDGGPLVCVAVRPETPDVSTFVFAPAEPRLFRFQPGQFMLFDLAAAGVQRCYTIASPPTRPFRIEITAKRTAAGPGSTWLHDSLRPGMRVSASLPMGSFVLDSAPDRPILMLSAGSGITPLMSMARTVHDFGGTTDILFVHSARTPADLIFDDELAAMARRPGFRRVSIVAAATAWDGLVGRLTPAMLDAVAPDLLQRDVFCCGPAPFMEAVRTMLDAAGFDRSRYHEESFDFAAAPSEAPPAPVAQDAASFTIRFTRSDRTVACPAGSTVLAAARAAGLRLPSACNKGVCGTCKSTLVSGTVTLRHGGGIRPGEIAGGFTLLCCARPTTDLVVDR